MRRAIGTIEQQQHAHEQWSSRPKSSRALCDSVTLYSHWLRLNLQLACLIGESDEESMTLRMSKQGSRARRCDCASTCCLTGQICTHKTNKRLTTGKMELDHFFTTFPLMYPLTHGLKPPQQEQTSHTLAAEPDVQQRVGKFVLRRHSLSSPPLMLFIFPEGLSHSC